MLARGELHLEGMVGDLDLRRLEGRVGRCCECRHGADCRLVLAPGRFNGAVDQCQCLADIGVGELARINADIAQHLVIVPADL